MFDMFNYIKEMFTPEWWMVKFFGYVIFNLISFAIFGFWGLFSSIIITFFCII